MNFRMIKKKKIIQNGSMLILHGPETIQTGVLMIWSKSISKMLKTERKYQNLNWMMLLNINLWLDTNLFWLIRKNKKRNKIDMMKKNGN